MILQGQTKDGIFAREPLGVFAHPNGTTWSSSPITKEQKKWQREYDKESKRIKELIEHGVDCEEAVIIELERIGKGTSIIPRRCREYLLKRFKRNR